jgi:hypothetical protein
MPTVTTSIHVSRGARPFAAPGRRRVHRSGAGLWAAPVRTLHRRGAAGRLRRDVRTPRRSWRGPTILNPAAGLHSIAPGPPRCRPAQRIGRAGAGRMPGIKFFTQGPGRKARLAQARPRHHHPVFEGRRRRRQLFVCPAGQSSPPLGVPVSHHVLECRAGCARAATGAGGAGRTAAAAAAAASAAEDGNAVRLRRRARAGRDPSGPAGDVHRPDRPRAPTTRGSKSFRPYVFPITAPHHRNHGTEPRRLKNMRWNQGYYVRSYPQPANREGHMGSGSPSATAAPAAGGPPHRRWCRRRRRSPATRPPRRNRGPPTPRGPAAQWPRPPAHPARAAPRAAAPGHAPLLRQPHHRRGAASAPSPPANRRRRGPPAVPAPPAGRFSAADATRRARPAPLAHRRGRSAPGGGPARQPGGGGAPAAAPIPRRTSRRRRASADERQQEAPGWGGRPSRARVAGRGAWGGGRGAWGWRGPRRPRRR